MFGERLLEKVTRYSIK